MTRTLDDTGTSPDATATVLAPPEGVTEGDLRAHARVPVELKVEYKKMNSFFSDYTRNISKGGTFIKTERPLDVGTEFVFQLFVPFQHEPFTLHGRVAWVNSADRVEEPKVADVGMGIRFVYGSDAQRADFEAVIEKVMAGALGTALSQRLLDRGTAP